MVGVTGSTVTSTSTSHRGGCSPPASAQAAWRAAPTATYSPGLGTATGTPNRSGAISCTAGDADGTADEQHPLAPGSRRRARHRPRRRGSAACPRARRGRGSRASRSSGSARAATRWPRAGWGCARRRGRAARVRPPAPGAPASARRSRPARSVPSIAAPAVRTRAALSVQTSGRKPPSASANDCTLPVGSADARELRAKAVPLVPSETTTSPGWSPRPSAAPMLSPVPAATASPDAVWPTTSAGAATRGTARSVPCREPEEVGAVLAGARRPVAGAGGVTAVGRPGVGCGRAVGADPAGEPVVGEHAGAGPGQVVGLVVAHPAQLAHRGRSDRDEPGGVGPGLGAELGDQVVGGLRRAGVVPQQRGSHDLAVLVEQHHAVLLAADGDRGDAVEDAVAARLLARRPTSGAGRPRCRRGARRARCARPPRSRRRRRRPCRTGSRCRPRRRADGQAWQSLLQDFLWSRPASGKLGAGSSARELGGLPRRPEAVGRIDAGA